MIVKSKIWKIWDNNYRVHVRKGLMSRICKILKEEPSAFYYKDKQLIAADYNVSANKKDRIKEFIKKNKLK